MSIIQETDEFEDETAKQSQNSSQMQLQTTNSADKVSEYDKGASTYQDQSSSRKMNNFISDGQAMSNKKFLDHPAGCSKKNQGTPKEVENETYYAINSPSTSISQPRDLFKVQGQKKNANGTAFIPQGVDRDRHSNFSSFNQASEDFVPSQTNSSRNSFEESSSTSVITMIKSKATKSMKNMFDQNTSMQKCIQAASPDDLAHLNKEANKLSQRTNNWGLSQFRQLQNANQSNQKIARQLLNSTNDISITQRSVERNKIPPRPINKGSIERSLSSKSNDTPNEIQRNITLAKTKPQSRGPSCNMSASSLNSENFQSESNDHQQTSSKRHRGPASKSKSKPFKMEQKFSPKHQTAKAVVLAQSTSQHTSFNSNSQSNTAPTATSPKNISIKLENSIRHSNGSNPSQAVVMFETPTRNQPDSKASVDNYLKSQRKNPDSIKEVNSRLQLLQGVIKKKMVEVFKVKKNLTSEKNDQDKDESKDSEQCDKFLEKFCQLNGFINMIIENDTEADKLMILSPIIEKHRNQLTKDQNNYIAEKKADTRLSPPRSIVLETQSDSNSQISSRYNQSSMSNPRKNITWLNYLVIIVEISQQILKLNSRKYNFIVKGNFDTRSYKSGQQSDTERIEGLHSPKLHAKRNSNDTLSCLSSRTTKSDSKRAKQQQVPATSPDTYYKCNTNNAVKKVKLQHSLSQSSFQSNQSKKLNDSGLNDQTFNSKLSMQKEDRATEISTISARQNFQVNATQLYPNNEQIVQRTSDTSHKTVVKPVASVVNEQDKNSETMAQSVNFTLSNLLNTSLGMFSSDSANNKDRHQTALTERAHARHSNAEGETVPSFERNQALANFDRQIDKNKILNSGKQRLNVDTEYSTGDQSETKYTVQRTTNESASESTVNLSNSQKHGFMSQISQKPIEQHKHHQSSQKNLHLAKLMSTFESIERDTGVSKHARKNSNVLEKNKTPRMPDNLHQLLQKSDRNKSKENMKNPTKDFSKPEHLQKAKSKGTQSAKNKFPTSFEKPKKQILSRNIDDMMKKTAKQSQRSAILVCDKSNDSKGQTIKSARNLKEQFALSMASDSMLSSKPGSTASKNPDGKKKPLFLSTLPTGEDKNLTQDERSVNQLFSPQTQHLKRHSNQLLSPTLQHPALSHRSSGSQKSTPVLYQKQLQKSYYQQVHNLRQQQTPQQNLMKPSQSYQVGKLGKSQQLQLDKAFNAIAETTRYQRPV